VKLGTKDDILIRCRGAKAAVAFVRSFPFPRFQGFLARLCGVSCVTLSAQTAQTAQTAPPPPYLAPLLLYYSTTYTTTHTTYTTYTTVLCCTQSTLTREAFHSVLLGSGGSGTARTAGTTGSIGRYRLTTVLGAGSFGVFPGFPHLF